MFDIGFPELFLVTVVMLVVLGPERLPETLRTLGLWLGRLRRSFTAVKAEIEKEVGMDEIKRQLHNEAIMDEMKRLESQVRGTEQRTADHAAETTAANGEDSVEPETTGSEDPGANPAASAAMPDHEPLPMAPADAARPEQTIKSTADQP